MHKTIYFDLDILMVSLFCFAQSRILPSSTTPSNTREPGITTVRSSANLENLVVALTGWRSIIIARKAVGPIPEPWIILRVNAKFPDFPERDITLWVRSVRKFASQLITTCGQPKNANLSNKIEWETLSNALLKSVRKHRAYSFVSQMLVTLWNKCTRAALVLPVGVKANLSHKKDFGNEGQNRKRTNNQKL